MIRNIIWDLGGVLLETDLEKMQQAFLKIRDPKATTVNYTRQTQHKLFTQYEIGAINRDEFAQGMRNAYQLQGTNAQIIEAWNAILSDVMPGRVEGLQKLMPYYNMVLLSNTNECHHEAYKDDCASLFASLQRCFYSFELKMRKPDEEIYIHVLNEMNWRAEDTLMVDDRPSNLEGAQKVGLQVYRVSQPQDFSRLLTELISIHSTKK